MKTCLIPAGMTAGLVLASAISQIVVAKDVEVIITKSPPCARGLSRCQAFLRSCHFGIWLDNLA